MSPDPSPQRPTRVRYLILGLACLVSWLLYLHRYAWGAVRSSIMDEYGFDNTQMETIYSAFNVTYAIGQIPSGALADLFGTHLFVSLAIAGWSVLVPAVGLTGSFFGLYGLRLAFGAAQAGCYPCLAHVTKHWFPVATRTVAQGWIAGFFGRVGGAMAPMLVGGLLMGVFGLSWRMALVVLGLFGLAVAVLFFVSFRSTPEEDPRTNDAERELIRRGEPPTTSRRPVLPWIAVLTNVNLMLFLTQQVFSAAADNIYVSLMPSYFESRGVDLTQASMLASLPLWGGAFGGLLGGVCNDLLIAASGSRRWARSVFGFSGKAIACGLLFVVVRQETALGAGLALFAVKFFTDWSQPTVWGAVTDLGGRYSGTIFGLLNTAGTLGAVVFQPVFGKILDWNTVQTSQGGQTDYNPLFLFVAGMYLASAACWLFIDCTRSVDREPAAD